VTTSRVAADEQRPARTSAWWASEEPGDQARQFCSPNQRDKTTLFQDEHDGRVDGRHLEPGRRAWSSRCALTPRITLATDHRR
jgi:hypothetical protein